jgi:hypothetical protein
LIDLGRELGVTFPSGTRLIGVLPSDGPRSEVVLHVDHDVLANDHGLGATLDDGPAFPRKRFAGSLVMATDLVVAEVCSARVPSAPRLSPACFLFAISLSACNKPSPAADLNDLGRELGMIFPSGTRLIGVSRERGIDDLIEVEVEMAASDFSGFLARTPVREQDFRPGERGLLGPDHDWWDPNKATGLRSGQAQLPKGRALNIGVGDSKSESLRVYIVNHGT